MDLNPVVSISLATEVVSAFFFFLRNNKLKMLKSKVLTSGVRRWLKQPVLLVSLGLNPQYCKDNLEPPPAPQINFKSRALSKGKKGKKSEKECCTGKGDKHSGCPEKRWQCSFGKEGKEEQQRGTMSLSSANLPFLWGSDQAKRPHSREFI